MLPAEHASQLIASIAALDRAADDALGATSALEHEPVTGDASRWLAGIRLSLERVQLECADLRHAARAVRDALPSSTTLQPRLL